MLEPKREPSSICVLASNLAGGGEIPRYAKQLNGTMLKLVSSFGIAQVPLKLAADFKQAAGWLELGGRTPIKRWISQRVAASF